jgi:hypothetical protein
MRHRPLRISIAVILATLALQAKASKCGADAQSTIATDRPQTTESSIVVPCGSLQFENGFLETSAGHQWGLDLPETWMRFGIRGKGELRFAVPDYFTNAFTGSGFAKGASDINIGYKQQLGPVKGFDVSLIPSFTIPTGAAGITSGGYDPAIQLPWSRSLSKNWTAAGMFSVMWPTQGARRNVTGQSCIYFDRQLTAPWDAYIEYSEDSPEHGSPQHAIDIGSAWRLSPHQQIDFHWSFGFSAAAPDSTVGLGYSVRFQVIRARQ